MHRVRSWSPELDSIYGEGENKHYPLYRFSTDELATTMYNVAQAVSDLG